MFATLDRHNIHIARSKVVTKSQVFRRFHDGRVQAYNSISGICPRMNIHSISTTNNLTDLQ